jgi:murein DD-endopeptidase MepM/ murein hydrolase activator NlpD
MSMSYTKTNKTWLTQLFTIAAITVQLATPAIVKAQNSELFCGPRDANPLRGFVDPSGGAGSVSGGHEGIQSYADDVALPMGASVYNMRKGRVTGLNDSHPDTGGDESNQLNANYIVIEYTDAPICTYKNSLKMRYDSLYLHIKQGSAKVKVGDIVEAGQEIAQVGYNGWTTGAHLHVEVNATTGPNWYQRVTVPYLWDNGRNRY